MFAENNIGVMMMISVKMTATDGIGIGEKVGFG